MDFCIAAEMPLAITHQVPAMSGRTKNAHYLDYELLNFFIRITSFAHHISDYVQVSVSYGLVSDHLAFEREGTLFLKSAKLRETDSEHLGGFLTSE